MSLLVGRSPVGEDFPRVVKAVRDTVSSAPGCDSAQVWLLTHRYVGVTDGLRSGRAVVRERSHLATSVAELVTNVGHVGLRDHPVQVTATDSRAVADEPTPPAPPVKDRK